MSDDDLAMRVHQASMDAIAGRDFVVVLMMASECDTYPGAPCVMEVLGPYDRDEAEQVLNGYHVNNPWTRPHRLRLRREEPGEVP